MFSKTAQILCTRVEVFSVLLNYPSVTVRHTIKLLLENVLNGEYALISVKLFLGKNLLTIENESNTNEILSFLELYLRFKNANV